MQVLACPFRSRTRLVILSLVLIGPVLLFASLVIFNSGGSNEAKQFNAELRKAAQELFVGYTQPVREVSQRTIVICKRVSPGSDVPDCARFINTIRDGDDTISTTITRLDTLLASPPPEVSQSVLTQMREILSLLQALRDSNHLLIEGWYEMNEAKWQEAWAHRESLAQEIGKLRD